MSTSCLLCCEQSEIWVLPPCNHKQICWKCCLKLVEGNIFSCPFCKHRPQHKSQLLFVKTDEMQDSDFQTVIRNNPFRSYKNSLYFYSNEEVAKYVQAQTSYHCTQCGEIHENINFLKKHLSNHHRVQFCEVCLDNRRCIIGQQRLYSDYDLQKHLKEGELSSTGEVVLYHPLCEFCNRRFYDLDAFKIHLKMGTHMKCEICDLNCSAMKFVYYRNYEQLQLHHRKTHFVCEVGDCINSKLLNVFASEALLQDHKRRFHRKYKPDKGDRIDNNILLGFNKKQQEDLIQYDGIGKDLSHEFTIFDVHGPVQREEHKDEAIDVREFYPEQTRITKNWRIDDAVHKLQQLHGSYGMKGREPQFSHIPIFKPLSMPTISKIDCQKLIRRCFSPRESQPLLDIFFNKRFEYRSSQQWFQVLQKRMRGWSSYSFFVVFPMLIRNLRETNKSKPLMDQFYCEKLHSLPVFRKFIFHELQNYSQLIEYTKNQTEKELQKRLQNNEIDLEQYAKFLKDMNMNFYFQKQESIYWVSKEKMIHLYHMVEHCSTKDFLKMNWLLKVGLTLPSYELLRKFYYIIYKDLPSRPLQDLTLQELALLKAYLTICLQAVLDHNSFKVAKTTPKPHYLTSAIDEIAKEPKIPRRTLQQLRKLQGRSGQIIQKGYSRKAKGIVIDQTDCPSLLEPIDIHKPIKKQKKQESPQLLLSRRQLPPQWNEDRAKIKKKLPLQTGKQEDQFPALCGPTQKPTKNQQKEAEEDFPVFDFKEKYVNRKANNSQKQQLSNLIGFNNKTVTRLHWDQNNTRKKIQADVERKRYEAELQRQRLEDYQNIQQTKARKKMKKREINTPKRQITPKQEMDFDNQDSYFKQAIAQSLRTAKLQEQRRTFDNSTRNERIISKKEKIVEQQPLPKNKKYKKQNNGALNNSANQSSTKEDYSRQVNKAEKKEQPLFERIEQEQKVVKQANFRLDMSSDQEQPKKIQKKVEYLPPKILSNSTPIFDDDDFVPLGSNSQQQSIINKIMKQSQVKQQQKPAPVNRNKGRRRKNRVDQSP